MRRTILLIGFTFLVVSCSSGDDNGTTSVQGLTLPKSINVAAATTSQALTSANTQLMAALYTDADTDYTNDKVNYYSDANSFFNLDNVNTLLCALDAMKVKEMVNQGAYTARLSSNICEQNTGDQGGDPASETFVDYVVLSTRLNNQSPHIIKMWAPLTEPSFNSNEPGAIESIFLIEIIIKESVSEQNPYGVFDFNYSIVVDGSLYGGTVGQTLTYGLANMKAFVTETDKPHFEVVYLSGSKLDEMVVGPAIESSGLVELSDTTGESGRAKSYSFYDDNGTIYEAARAAEFNASYLLTTKDNNDASTEQCYSRTEYETIVLDYNLYFTSDGTFRSKDVTGGQRVELNSYFVFRYDGQYGSASERWYWLSRDDRLPDQAVVTEFETNEPYTVHISPGVLTQLDTTQSPSQSKRMYPTDTDFFTEPSQAVTLSCYANCPMGGMTQRQIDAASGTSDLYYNGGAFDPVPYTYTTAVVDNYKVVLKDNSNGDAWVDFTNLNLDSLPVSLFGITSGALYPEGSSPDNGDVTYTWNSGPFYYSHLAVFVDGSNQIMQTEPSLKFDYVHDVANDRFNTDPSTNKYDGVLLNLYYYDAGQLSGFPEYEISTGVFVSVGLIDGVILDNDEGSFAVKATRIKHSLVVKDSSECTGLDADAVLNDQEFQLPDAANVVDVSFTGADRPIVDDDPKVIDGVLQ